MRIHRYGLLLTFSALWSAAAGCAGSAAGRPFRGFRTSDGISIAAELDVPDEAGPHPLVLLGHQVGTDRRSWDPLVPLLVDRGYAALRVDRRAFGESTKEVASPADLSQIQKEAHTLDLVEAIAAVADRPEVDASRIAVVGSDFSVHAAVRCAIEYPDSVRVLVLLSGAIPRLEEEWLLEHPELPILLIAAGGHWPSAQAVRRHAERLTGPEQRYVEFEPLDETDDAHWIGTDGLREETGLADLIAWFLDEHLPVR